MEILLYSMLALFLIMFLSLLQSNLPIRSIKIYKVNVTDYRVRYYPYFKNFLFYQPFYTRSVNEVDGDLYSQVALSLDELKTLIDRLNKNVKVSYENSKLDDLGSQTADYDKCCEFYFKTLKKK